MCRHFQHPLHGCVTQTRCFNTGWAERQSFCCCSALGHWCTKSKVTLQSCTTVALVFKSGWAFSRTASNFSSLKAL